MASQLELENDNQKVLGHNMRKEEDEAFSIAMNLAVSTAMPTCLHTAFELGVFDIIAKAGEGAKLSSAEIAAQMSTNNHDAPTMLDRILKLLASYSVLGCSVVCDDKGSHFRRLYSLVPVSKYFVTNEDGVSLGPLAALGHDKVFQECWSQLKGSVLEGGLAFNRAHGMDVFEYSSFDQRFNKVFNLGMQNNTTIVMKNILEHYNGFQHLKELVDVGGGLGETLKQITSIYPHIKGINFDLPHVVANAPSYPAVEHVGGDMFESVPRGDAIFLKSVLHDWSDEHCLKVLKNCFKAIPEYGKVIVVEVILPVMPENSFYVQTNFVLDVVMMTVNPGGKERSQQEFLALATGAGFSGIKFVCCVFNYWVMEFYK